ncbi:MAG: tRNA threonylcarbamoyladenosine biosynthesis protein TsaB [Chloroflexi bacterium]|jgi:tRNA threonylcarbamoyladenosine biosynthesis protein TsaB|nr:MAG: tRNA threonylcarbamoyladenosine biosynthesis protein TsaB [Chloroflexota bacterium]
MLLAIDTSTRNAGLALINDELQILRSVHWRSERNHSIETAPAIEQLLDIQGISKNCLKAVAIAKGPGNFSSLRVGISIAKGLAWSLDLPLVTATTLEVEAWPYLRLGPIVCAVIDAGRGEVSCASFSYDDGRIYQKESERIVEPIELFDSLEEDSIICGEGLEAHMDLFTTHKPGYLRLALPNSPPKRAISLAQISMGRFKEGIFESPESMQAHYLRQPTITLPKQGAI